jgi:hypothetical protein
VRAVPFSRMGTVAGPKFQARTDNFTFGMPSVAARDECGIDIHHAFCSPPGWRAATIPQRVQRYWIGMVVLRSTTPLRRCERLRGVVVAYAGAC